MNTALILSIIAIIVSIVIGYKFKVNAGILAMVFSFIIGILGMGLKVKNVVSYFPTTIFFLLLSISLFYNYAVNNGTMALIGKKLLYALNGNAKIIPLACYLISAIVAALGCGGTTCAIIGPFIFAIAIEANVNPIITACALGLGSLTGAGNPFNGEGGVVCLGLVESLGYSDPSKLMLGV